ncbi:MAG: thiamine phosphate synthase [Parvibaculaceae bacterium]
MKDTMRLPARIAMTDAGRRIDPFAQLRCLAPGDAIILRHYEWDNKERRELAGRLRAASRARRVKLLIAGDPRLAVTVRADGIHLPGWQLRQGYVWQERPSSWLVTAAAHGRPELIRAERAGADACLLSPVFATGSHPGAKSLGPVRFAALVHGTGLPVYALGGMNERTCPRLNGTGLAGWAAVSGL